MVGCSAGVAAGRVKRIVVTGASGFIGSATIAPLLKRGFEVHALGRGGAVPGATAHACDLLADDPVPMLRAIRPTYLLHLAWYAEPGKFWASPANLDWVAASLRLVRAFAEAGGARLVGAGTCAEYDWSGDGVLDERTTPLAPATLYGAAKAALFGLLAAAAPVLGLSFAWGRVFFPYGAREQPGRLLSSILDGIAAGAPVPMSEGTQRRDFLHVDDVGAAFAALADSAVEGAVNIGSGEVVSVRAFAQAAAEAAGGAHLLRPGTRPMQAGEPLLLVARTDRLRHEVAFSHRHDLASGLADAVVGRRA